MKLRSKSRSDSAELEIQEREAVAGARSALAQIIAEGSHDDRSRAIEAIRSLDGGWKDDEAQWTVSFRLAKCYDARFGLLGSFSGKTDELPSKAGDQMKTALYAIDHLANVLLTGLAAVGVAIYPTLDTTGRRLDELPAASKDPLLSAIEDIRRTDRPGGRQP